MKDMGNLKEIMGSSHTQVLFTDKCESAGTLFAIFLMLSYRFAYNLVQIYMHIIFYSAHKMVSFNLITLLLLRSL